MVSKFLEIAKFDKIRVGRGGESHGMQWNQINAPVTIVSECEGRSVVTIRFESRIGLSTDRRRSEPHMIPQ